MCSSDLRRLVQTPAFRHLRPAPNGKGGAEFMGKTYGDKKVIDASQYFAADHVEAVAIAGYESQVSLDKQSKTLTVTYKK